MSVPYDSTHTDDAPQFWTLAGLASWFGVSESAIRKYKEWGLVDPALGKFPHGLNYTHIHFTQIAKVRADLARVGHHIALRDRAHRPHVVVVERREQVA